MRSERLAPAKVNLFLHVGPVGADGYHPLCSLATFADVGDVVRAETAPTMAFEVVGAFAAELAGESGNLALRARDLVLAGLREEPKPFRLTLDKRLPIAAGLGGGSSDAAATLMLLGERFDWSWLKGEDREEALAAMALRLGSDTPMCLKALPTIAQGRGEALTSPPAFPDLPAVLVNPLVQSPTAAVYRAYDAAGAPGGADAPIWPSRLATPEAMASFLAGCRNDLEAPAIGLQPVIGQSLAGLRARPEALLARISGSGATCFALCADRAARDELALAIGDAHRDWWVRPCWLRGFAP
jgi:4-diphosphocytidyl-2-C-methyl-D-erythritol kinase